MYKMLIVDDEYSIRNGIKLNCNWNQYNIDDVETAVNGLDAWEKIRTFHPDFIITDVKMPVMDGLTLIKKVSETYPDILCAVLSGYDEFDFVRKALQFKTLDYLLKPCSIETIHELTERMTIKKREQDDKKGYLIEIEKKYAHMKNLLSEQVLKDYIITSYIKEEEISLYMNINTFLNKELRLILIKLEDNSNRDILFFLQQFFQSSLEKETEIYVCTLCNDILLILINYFDNNTLLNIISKIKKDFNKHYSLNITIAIGEKSNLEGLKSSYKNLLIYLSSYLPETDNDIITAFDIKKVDFSISSNIFNIDLFCLSVQRGDIFESAKMLNTLYYYLKNSNYKNDKIRSYMTHIYVSLIQIADSSLIEKYLDGITQINSMPNLREIIILIEKTAKNIISAKVKVEKKQNDLVIKMINYIDEYISDEHLSINFIANKLLFVNSDYLGKLFSKEYGEKFSTYVTKKRINLAKTLILKNPNISIGEIALQTGFGYNSQYFSKVFKKNTGYTPTDYRTKFSN